MGKSRLDYFSKYYFYTLLDIELNMIIHHIKRRLNILNRKHLLNNDKKILFFENEYVNIYSNRKIDGGHKMKKYILNLVPFIITAICIISYNIIGAEVLPDGRLSEPFYLIPIAWLFFFIGIIGFVANLLLYIKNKKANI